MSATLQAARKPRAATVDKSGERETEAAKLRRARQMLKELRAETEALLISSQRTLARVKRMAPPEQ